MLSLLHYILYLYLYEIFFYISAYLYLYLYEIFFYILLAPHGLMFWDSLLEKSLQLRAVVALFNFIKQA